MCKETMCKELKEKQLTHQIQEDISRETEIVHVYMCMCVCV